MQPYGKNEKRSLRFDIGLVVIVAVAVSVAGCSGLSLEAAKDLGKIGEAAAMQNAANMFASSTEYERAMEALAFSRAGRPDPETLDLFEAAQVEVRCRKYAYLKLGDAYQAFSELAAEDVSTKTENAIQAFGESVNALASLFPEAKLVSSVPIGTISKIGGLAAEERQKKKIKEASELIRKRLEIFVSNYKSPKNEVMLVTYRKALGNLRANAVQEMWRKGLLDPTPLINQLGEEAGLGAVKDVGNIVARDDNVKDGLNGVINVRFDRSASLMGYIYKASIESMEELIRNHGELEKGEPFDVDRILGIVTKMKIIAEALSQESVIVNMSK